MSGLSREGRRGGWKAGGCMYDIHVSRLLGDSTWAGRKGVMPRCRNCNYIAEIARRPWTA